MKFLLTGILILHIPSVIGQEFSESGKVVSSDRHMDDNFGLATSISGNYALISSPYNDTGANGAGFENDAGAAYIFKNDGSENWQEIQKIVANDRKPEANFGYSASIDGDYVIIGAPGEVYDEFVQAAMTDAGCAYIFERGTDDQWNQVQKIVPSDRSANDIFGFSVSISGNYAIVGAYGNCEDVNGNNYQNAAGSAYIFERNSSGEWIEVQKLVASDRNIGDLFGKAVCIDGNRAIVASVMNDSDLNGGNLQTNAGAIYVFERNNLGYWSETQKIVASDRAAGDAFGTSIALSGDILLVGALGEDEDSGGTNTLNCSGAAYVYERDANNSWTEVKKLVATDRGFNDWFGYSVAASDQLIVVGALFEDENPDGNDTRSDAGAAYIFERDYAGNWTETQKIVHSDRSNGDIFGGSISISGSTVLVGAVDEDENTLGNGTQFSSGSAYFFRNPSAALNKKLPPPAALAYPNPTSDYLTVDLGAHFTGLKMTVFDVSGTTTGTFDLQDTQSFQVKLDGAPGIYFIALTSEGVPLTRLSVAKK